MWLRFASLSRLFFQRVRERRATCKQPPPDTHAFTYLESDGFANTSRLSNNNADRLDPPTNEQAGRQQAASIHPIAGHYKLSRSTDRPSPRSISSISDDDDEQQHHQHQQAPQRGPAHGHSSSSSRPPSAPVGHAGLPPAVFGRAPCRRLEAPGIRTTRLGSSGGSTGTSTLPSRAPGRRRHSSSSSSSIQRRRRGGGRRGGRPRPAPAPPLDAAAHPHLLRERPAPLPRHRRRLERAAEAAAAPGLERRAAVAPQLVEGVACLPPRRPGQGEQSEQHDGWCVCVCVEGAVGNVGVVGTGGWLPTGRRRTIGPFSNTICLFDMYYVRKRDNGD